MWKKTKYEAFKNKEFVLRFSSNEDFMMFCDSLISDGIKLSTGLKGFIKRLKDYSKTNVSYFIPCAIYITFDNGCNVCFYDPYIGKESTYYKFLCRPIEDYNMIYNPNCKHQTYKMRNGTVVYVDYERLLVLSVDDKEIGSIESDYTFNCKGIVRHKNIAQFDIIEKFEEKKL